MVFQFKIKIEGLSKPPVWRKVEVPAHFSFEQMHYVIQSLFGWYNGHLYCFEPRVNKRSRRPAFRIEEPIPDMMGPWYDTESLVASETVLSQVFPTYQEILYIYDFGDNWCHSITLEGILEEDRKAAVCTGGKGTTPPEDCGGIWGYNALKSAFAENDEEEMAEYREWLGMDDDETWDPDGFSEDMRKAINASFNTRQG